MVLPAHESLHEFGEELRHLETEYGALYLQNLQELYRQTVEEDKMAEKLAAFKAKIDKRLS